MTSLCKFSPNLSFVWNGHFPDNSGHHFNTPNLILRDRADTCWVQGASGGESLELSQSQSSGKKGNIHNVHIYTYIEMRSLIELMHAHKGTLHSFHRKWVANGQIGSLVILQIMARTGWVWRSILAEMSIQTNYGLHNDLNSTSNFTHSCCSWLLAHKLHIFPGGIFNIPEYWVYLVSYMVNEDYWNLRPHRPDIIHLITFISC